jgi:hypothetical protein
MAGRRLRTFQHIPHAAEGLDQLFVVAFLDLVAHAADEDVDDVGLRVDPKGRCLSPIRSLTRRITFPSEESISNDRDSYENKHNQRNASVDDRRYNGANMIVAGP